MNDVAPSQPSTSSRRVYLETFGCQMNILDSELVRDQLQGLGYQFVPSAEEANIVLFNTCSVRALSEQKVLSRLGITKKRKEAGEELIVGVLGCMAERTHTEIFKKNPHIDLLVGPSKLAQVAGILENLHVEKHQISRNVALSDYKDRKGKSIDEATMDDLEALDSGRALTGQDLKTQAYVRITRGCNKFCAFCVVPRTRGPEVHRHPDSIVEEIKRLAERGVLEVTLLGQTINHYDYIDGPNKRTSFADLLRRIHDEVPTLPRLRFLTSYPRDFTDEALDVMASSPRICKYLHIPAQSGSDSVLKRMNRGYTRDIYMSLIERARSRMPGIAILGDMIVGFPGETDEDFELSLDLLREVKYKNIFVFKYSPRPGTVADRRDPDDIPKAVKEERNRRMLEVQNEISLEHHLSMIGQTITVIVEGSAKIDPSMRGASQGETSLISISKRKTNETELKRLSARSEGDHIVSFDGHPDLVGQIVQVKIVDATALSLSGELYKE